MAQESSDRGSLSSSSEDMQPPCAYPHSGRCFNCGRDRDDLFWHADAEAFYCCDVFRCEARKQIIEDRNYQFWLEQLR